jgi:hypothetical protein
MRHYEKASCSTPGCGGSFDLIPPADPQYKIPKEKSESDDNIERTYPCDKEKHQNTIYWRREKPIFVESQHTATDDYESFRKF